MKTIKKILDKFDLGKLAWGLIIGLIVLAVASWGVTCLVWSAVCLLFGWEFSWAVATGIWIILSIITKTF